MLINNIYRLFNNLQKRYIILLFLIPLISSCRPQIFYIGEDKKISESLKNTKDEIVVGKDLQLERLYDYTKFHIGIYISLTTGILAALKYKTTEKTDLLYILPILCFAMAGMSGGVICSNIPNYKTYSASQILLREEDPEPTTVMPFLDGEFHSLGFNLSYKNWSALEHNFFWSGCLLFTLLFILQNFDYFVNKKWLKNEHPKTFNFIFGDKYERIEQGNLKIEFNSDVIKVSYPTETSFVLNLVKDKFNILLTEEIETKIKLLSSSQNLELVKSLNEMSSIEELNTFLSSF